MTKTNLLIVCFGIFWVGCLPIPPKYPYFDENKVDQEASQLSERLEKYIKLWYEGKVPALLPDSVLPKGYDNARYKNIRLIKIEEITPEQQWVFRPAHKINFEALYGSFPDPNCSYLLAPIMYAPFGTKLYIEGEYPYCRFFSVQVTASFDTKEYRYDKWSGRGEVGWVDTDIPPMEGSNNPFLPNAHRYTKERKYRLEAEMAMGNPSVLNPSHRFPYRSKNEKMYISGIQFQGAWGVDKKSGHGRGYLDFGDIWVRYYAIDHQKDTLGGVKMPFCYYELPTGEKFWITADFEGLKKASETTMPNRNKGDRDPSKYHTNNIGWDKQFGIFLQIASGGSIALYRESAKDKQYIRDLDLGVNGRGENQQPPASYEPHATGSNYTNYLTTGISIKKGKIFVLTGKLPTFPDTRNGNTTLTPAQCRYWSITSYDAEFPFSEVKGLENTCIMDDEIVLNEKREYIIVYSRKEDRPKNATAENGVTWVEWGNTCTQSFTLRWISVSPEWAFEYTPHELNLPWAYTTWSGSKYDKTIIGSNEAGFLKDYHPIKHYMTKETFEQLGNVLDKNKIPLWNE
ncbi:MAG: hypothetical protein EAZ55_10570 [Cytophagales bacterium]|nr:MAG: hypothetical protein EAZ55_10570 [Cytophagales bacterium]